MAEALYSAPTPPFAAPFDPRGLVSLLDRLAPAVGTNATAMPEVEVTRATEPRLRAPVVTQPCICIVAQGSKRAYHGGEVYCYDPYHYLVLSVPLPIEGQIVEASPEKPYLALRLAVDPLMLGELLFDMGEGGAGEVNRRARRGIFVSRLDERHRWTS